MTHIISDKSVLINGMIHTVTAVDGLDTVDINNQLHHLNVEMDKLKAKQSELIQMRERAESADDLFNEMFGG